MTDMGAAWPAPQDHRRRGRRRSATAFSVIAAVVLVVAVALVRVFDRLTEQASMAQLVQQGGPLYRVPTTDAPPPGAQLLGWLTDARALTIWGLTMAAVFAYALARRPRRG